MIHDPIDYLDITLGLSRLVSATTIQLVTAPTSFSEKRSGATVTQTRFDYIRDRRKSRTSTSTSTTPSSLPPYAGQDFFRVWHHHTEPRRWIRKETREILETQQDETQKPFLYVGYCWYYIITTVGVTGKKRLVNCGIVKCKSSNDSRKAGMGSGGHHRLDGG